jgi:hypothetical protein
LIFDGGGGLLSVILVREGEAFVGPGEPDALEGLFGVPIGLGDLVTALLTGEPAAGEYRVVRRPATGTGLPEWMEIRGDAAGLELELKRRQVLPASATVGTGAPPPGLTVRPLSELRLQDVPLDDGPSR